MWLSRGACLPPQRSVSRPFWVEIHLGVLPAGLVAEFLGGQVAIGILAALMLAVSGIVLLTQKQLREFQ